MVPFNAFGCAFRSGLADLNMSQEDFMRLLRKRYGVYLDSGYLFKLKTGRQHVPKMENRILELLSDLKNSTGYDPVPKTDYIPQADRKSGL